jgi:hypothetical protein
VPLVVLSGTMHIELDNAIDSTIDSTHLLQKKNLLVNTTSNSRTLHTLKHVEKFKLHDLKKKIAYQFPRGIEISFPLHCKIFDPWQNL